MRTVFGRLLATYILIVVVILVLSGFFIAQTYSSEYIAQRNTELSREGRQISELSNLWAYGHLSQAAYLGALSAISRQYSAVIWITNMSGTKAMVLSEVEPQDFSVNRDVDISPMQDAFENILAGQSVYLEGNFDAYFGGSTLTVGYPLQSGNTVTGAILLHTSLSEMNRGIINIYRRVGLSVGICGIVAIILVYFMARRISNPLVQLSEAVKEYAKGDFNKTVTVKTRDEIGELCKSINEMSADLKNLETMRRDFISTAAHEIRTPLTGIRGYVDALLDGTIPESQKDEYLKRVRGEVLRLSTLVTGLLDISQLDSDSPALDIASVELNELIRRVLISFEQEISKKHIQVQAGLYKEKILVQADAQRVEQVMRNILHNAIKFTQDHGHILVSSGISRHWVYFAVRDDGIGISEEKQRHVFERFYQADSAHTPGQGVGLGLSIVHSIVQQHGGKVRLWSRAGEGTRVLVALPRRAEPAENK